MAVSRKGASSSIAFAQCRNLIKKPWAFIGVPEMNPTILGVIGPGFLNQVATLLRIASVTNLNPAPIYFRIETP